MAYACPMLRRLLVSLSLLLLVLPARAAEAAAASSTLPWWFWPLALFLVCFVMGIVAVPAGIGGGTLFVPIVGSFFPFHLDFVRGAGTLVAMASALAAGPMLLRNGMASLRLALPLLGAAFGLQYLGLLAERWFFLAQANHPQNLYYQAVS